MSQNPLTELTHQLIDYFAIYPENEDARRMQRYGELIRYHNENLIEFGDLSIAASYINWHCFSQKQGLQLRMQSEQMLPDDESREDLLEQSKKWIFPLQNVTKLRKERYALRFYRPPIIAHVLNSILKHGENYGQHKKLEKSASLMPTLCLTLHEQFLDPEVGNTKELHKFRARQLYLIVCRLLAYANWRLVEPQDQTPETLLVSVECNNQPRRFSTDQMDKKSVRMVCGPVLEPTKKTATMLTSGSYMALRSNDMLLIAMHRHGVRDCAKGTDFESLMQRLGHAAVIVDLFEVRHGSGATVVRNGLGSSKGANYILYNSARLETLLRTFAAQVDAGVYEPLPPLEKIDLSVLEDELDWQLIYGYLLTFPELVESTLVQLDQGLCAVHLLVRYIVDLASLFSRYYRNKQILVQQRSNLMPVLYARIYLVKAVREVLNAALALLGIQPVDYM
ncbi:DALR anticodon-binding domain-containing protein 3 [Drosophila virilis]|uniref:DALR anticodon binding domain-containing protein n=1 Tax=Drosophila virilis TaxID=7244 RepID=B4M3K5_DROVI|nr:DALR anticodon-binding domain-containing protein 3 [Drosophila virilis]EDW65380.1 uncharacterized protein Dvir_GJ18934 [Drosophila virilis]